MHSLGTAPLTAPPLAGNTISPENFIPELSATGAADLAALMAAPPRRIPALAAAFARNR